MADERETRNPAGTLAFLTYGDQLNRNRKEGLMDWNRIEGELLVHAEVRLVTLRRKRKALYG